MTNTETHLEIEVKFHLDDPREIKDKLAKLEIAPGQRVFETNVLYDDCRSSLTNSGKLLRLRKDDRCRLTFKSRPPETDPDYKIYHELEVTLSDADTTEGILKALGFDAVQIYEKWRQTYVWGDSLLCIDKMPYGDFLEIEGPKATIQKCVDQLGLDWEQRMVTNYLAIFEILRQKEKLPFNDITFANFNQHPVDIRPYLNLFRDR